MQRIKLQLELGAFQIMLPGQGLFVEEYWPWVGGICKCLRANARGFPGVNPPGWPRISALLASGSAVNFDNVMTHAFYHQ